MFFGVRNTTYLLLVTFYFLIKTRFSIFVFWIMHSYFLPFYILCIHHWQSYTHACHCCFNFEDVVRPPLQHAGFHPVPSSMKINLQTWNLLEVTVNITSAFVFVRVALLFYGNAEQTVQISEQHYHATMTLTLTTIKGDMLFNMTDYLT